MNSTNISILSVEKAITFAEVFWRKIREDMRMEVLIEKKPLKQLKLYEIQEEDLNIDLNEVCLWSQDNSKLYFQIKENGFADFICNKETVIENYTELIFDKEKICEMDTLLLKFGNLNVLRLNKNRVTCIENIPANLKELHLYSNPVQAFSPKLRQEQLMYLGLGYCYINDVTLEGLAKKLPNLICVDLTHNQLCDLEQTFESMKMLPNLKILSLYGNPIIFMPQYHQTFVDGLINLKFLDDEKTVDIKNRILQVLQEKQAAKQAEQLRILQEQQAKEEAAKMPDKGKKGKQPPAQKKEEPEVQAPNRINTQASKLLEEELEEFKIQLRDATQFKIVLKVQTLENLQGILLDKTPETESRPELLQTRYWLQFKFGETELVTLFASTYTTQTSLGNPILYENATVENDRGIIDFEFVHEFIFVPSIEIRDEIMKGFCIQVHYEQPKMILVIDPLFSSFLRAMKASSSHSWERTISPCRSQAVWESAKSTWTGSRLRTARSSKRSTGFSRRKSNSRLSCGLPTRKNRYVQELVESHMEVIEKEIKKEEEEAQKLLAEIEAKKEALKAGKGKDQKKKDDKKGKKGKEEVEKKVIQQLDWEVDERQYVFVSAKKIHRSKNILLGVSAELTH